MMGAIILLLLTISHVSYGATVFDYKLLEKENIGYFGPPSFNTTSRINKTATESSFREIWCGGIKCQNGVESCKDGKCDCPFGLSGNDCGQVMGCTRELKNICHGLILECIYDPVTKSKATCKCDEVNQKFDGKACRVNCKPSDSKCKFGTSCQLQNGNYFCSCPPDLTGDFCEVITACQRGGKYEKCTEGGGLCKLVENMAVCECENEKIFDVSKGICREEKTTTLEEVSTKKNILISTSNPDCDCGTNSFMCELGVNGEKMCTCHSGYAQANGICTGICLRNADCRNGGACRIGEGGIPFCTCRYPFTGEWCDVHAECAKLDCGAAGAVCTVQGDKAECECPLWTCYNADLKRCQGMLKIWIITIASISINAVLSISFLCYCCISRRRRMKYV